MPGTEVINPAKIGIILGSASDLDVIKKGTAVLDELGINYECAISSAHRTPADTENYAKKAQKRGIEVIIAVAGLSAALPGVIAANTQLPVVGLPVKGGALDGLDALLSIAQMPPGVPVGSVGLNAAQNACLMAARIVAIRDKSVARRLLAWTKKQSQKVIDSRAKITENNIQAAPDDAY